MRKRSIGASVALVATAALSSGCGLVFQGFHQDVNIVTTGGPASVTFAGETKTDPATFKVRRYSQWRVARAQAPGKLPACVLVRCAQRTSLKVLDIIPLFIPFGIDSALSTLGNCPNTVQIQLRDLPKGVQPFVIPDDLYIVKMFEGSLKTTNVCAAPHLFSPEFARQAEHIVVTSGLVQAPHNILGSVDFTIEGFDRTRTSSSAFATGAVGFGVSSSVREFSQASPETMNEVLRREALLKYGTAVDAVINVDYMTNPKNDVSATGLAVQFRDEASVD